MTRVRMRIRGLALAHYLRERQFVSGVRHTYCGLLVDGAWVLVDDGADSDTCMRCVAVADRLSR